MLPSLGNPVLGSPHVQKVMIKHICEELVGQVNGILGAGSWGATEGEAKDEPMKLRKEMCPQFMGDGKSTGDVNVFFMLDLTEDIGE